MTARRVLPGGLARDAGIFEVLSGLAPLHPRNDTLPGEVFLHLAADAVEWCVASRASRCPWRTARAVPARVRLPRTGEREAPEPGLGRSGRSRPD